METKEILEKTKELASGLSGLDAKELNRIIGFVEGIKAQKDMLEQRTVSVASATRLTKPA